MTLYFDYRVNIGELNQNAAFTAIEWHSQQPLLSVALFSVDKGGAVYLCDELVSFSIFDRKFTVTLTPMMLWYLNFM